MHRCKSPFDVVHQCRVIILSEFQDKWLFYLQRVLGSCMFPSIAGIWKRSRTREICLYAAVCLLEWPQWQHVQGSTLVYSIPLQQLITCGMFRAVITIQRVSFCLRVDFFFNQLCVCFYLDVSCFETFARQVYIVLSALLFHINGTIGILNYVIGHSLNQNLKTSPFVSSWFGWF